jgi:hypothetical protein
MGRIAHFMVAVFYWFIAAQQFLFALVGRVLLGAIDGERLKQAQDGMAQQTMLSELQLIHHAQKYKAEVEAAGEWDDEHSGPLMMLFEAFLVIGWDEGTAMKFIETLTNGEITIEEEVE